MYDILYIHWNEANDIGIAIIDEQHRAVVSTINSLYYFMHKGIDADVTRATVASLKQYSKIHFATEESLLAEAEYPQYEEHIALHENFISKIQDLAVTQHNYQDSLEILTFLKKWWLGHINNEDRKYIPYLAKQTT